MGSIIFKRDAIRYSIYFLILLSCSALQVVPEFMTLLNARPILVIGTVVSICMFENVFVSALFGLAAGFFCDFWAFHLFGFASSLFLVLSATCALLVAYLVQNNLRIFTILTACFSSIYCFFTFYVVYGMWGYPGISLLIGQETIPTILLTIALAIPQYFLVRKIFNKYA